MMVNDALCIVHDIDLRDDFPNRYILGWIEVCYLLWLIVNISIYSSKSKYCPSVKYCTGWEFRG